MKRYLNRLLIVTCLLAGFTPAVAQTIVGETTVTKNIVWESSQGPFFIQGNITIEEGGTLEIGSGCELIFEGNYEIAVKGALSIVSSHLYGKDLGNGLNVLWKGTRLITPSAEISYNECRIRHARVALDLQALDSNVSINVTLQGSTFETNQTAILNTSKVIQYSINGCHFINNDIGIDRPNPDALYLPHVFLRGCQFIRNGIGIRRIHPSIEGCTFNDNDTALIDLVFGGIDSSAFNNNLLAFRGHSVNIDRCLFVGNDLATDFTDRNLNRDNQMFPSEIGYSVFRGNDVAVNIQGAAIFSTIECSIFENNGVAVNAPSRVFIYSDNYVLRRNVFTANQRALEIHQEGFSPTPLGTFIARIQLEYNILNGNAMVLENTSTVNLNFFNNHMKLDKTGIEAALVDGSDSNQYGLVNYTVSADSFMIFNDTLYANKVMNVVKHSDYDTAKIIGNTYFFEVCSPQGIPSGHPNIEREETLVFPNPFHESIHLNFYGNDPHLRLYSLSGKEIPIRVETISDTEYVIYPNDLPPGIYLLRIGHEGGWESIKLQKLPH